MAKLLHCAATAIALIAAASPLQAQQTGGDLRGQQQALLANLKRDPSNAELMWQYAEASMRVDDYSATIRVLERLLSSPSHARRAAVELGVAHFYLGNYDQAERYLTAALNDPDTTGAMRQRAELHLDEIRLRTGGSNSLATALGIDYGIVGGARSSGPSEPVVLPARPAPAAAVARVEPAPATVPRVEPVPETTIVRAEPAPAPAPVAPAVSTPAIVAPTATVASPAPAPAIVTAAAEPVAETRPAVVPASFGAVAAGVPSGTPEGRQRQLYAQLLADPSNIDLMFDYVEASMQLRDYEAAIATLERMLIYNRELTRVRLELGAAYYALGSYEVAKLYFNQVLSDPETDDATRSRIAQYLGEIEGRTDRSSFSMVANLGITYSSNANLGPLDDEVVVGGVPGFVLDDDSQAEDDFGVRTLVTGTHAYDMQQPNTNAWITDFSFFGLRYFEVEAGNTAFARLRTGPRLALNPEQYGPKVRPYVEGQYLNAADESVFWNGTGGAEYTRALGEQWAAFADASVGYYDFVEDRDPEDMTSFRLVGGTAFLPSRDFVARFMATAERDMADADYNSNYEIGARASADYQYDSGIDFVDRKWVISGYADARHRWYDESDAFIDPGETRRDTDLRLGVSHLFAIQDGFGIKLDVEALKRDSNIRNFELENIGVTLSAQKRL